ncbi:MAG TPA: YezD family protein [Desulfosporosinus sp.]
MVEKPRVIHFKRKSLGQEDLRKLLEIIEEVSHGSVTLIIQDGIVIQIDRHEKLRLRKRSD